MAGYEELLRRDVCCRIVLGAEHTVPREPPRLSRVQTQLKDGR